MHEHTAERVRHSYFDNLKLLLIILVVVGHSIEIIRDSSRFLHSVYLFIYAFHMPLFVFISGYFTKKSIGPDQMQKIILRLVIPYVFFEIIYTLIDYYLLHLNPELSFSFFTPTWILWYLLCIIIWRIVLPYALLLRYPLVITFGIALLAGYASDIGYAFSLSRAIVFFPFFLAGHLFETKHLDRLLASPLQYKRIASIAILITIFAILYQWGSALDPRWLYGSYGYARLGFAQWNAALIRLWIFAFAVLMSTATVLLVYRRPIHYLTALGERTFYAFLLHGVVIKLAIYSGVYLLIDSAVEYVILFGYAIVVAFFLCSSFIREVFKHLFELQLPWLFKKM